MKLDVGCGWNYKGDINVDLFLGKPIFGREDEQSIYKGWKRTRMRSIPNFICADCNCLPFRNNIFDVVFCHHTLEHRGVNLVQTCRELIRVANGKIVITVPSQLSASASGGLHDKVFTAELFHILFKHYERRVKYVRRGWQDVNLPSRYLRWATRRLSHFLNLIACPVHTEILCEVGSSLASI